MSLIPPWPSPGDPLRLTLQIIEPHEAERAGPSPEPPSSSKAPPTAVRAAAEPRATHPRRRLETPEGAAEGGDAGGGAAAVADVAAAEHDIHAGTMAAKKAGAMVVARLPLAALAAPLVPPAAAKPLLEALPAAEAFRGVFREEARGGSAAGRPVHAGPTWAWLWEGHAKVTRL